MKIKMVIESGAAELHVLPECEADARLIRVLGWTGEVTATVRCAFDYRNDVSEARVVVRRVPPPMPVLPDGGT